MEGENLLRLLTAKIKSEVCDGHTQSRSGQLSSTTEGDKCPHFPLETFSFLAVRSGDTHIQGGSMCP